MRKKLAIVLAASLMLALSSGPAAFAASNPSGTGQPGAECGTDPGDSPIEPQGFSTKGFANAEDHYANTDGTHAVSQYDVACYQLSSKG